MTLLALGEPGPALARRTSLIQPDQRRAVGLFAGAAQGTVAATADTVVLAGEALSARAVRDIRSATSCRRIANIYGPTEATVYVTAWYLPQTEG